MFRIGQSTVYKIIPEVCKAIASELLPKYVGFPNKKKWLCIFEEFKKKCDFPNCIGALDGCYIKIQKPPHAGVQFKNYKKFHSIVLMITCDANRIFTWFNLGDYGKQKLLLK